MIMYQSMPQEAAFKSIEEVKKWAENSGYTWEEKDNCLLLECRVNMGDTYYIESYRYWEMK